MSRPAAIAEDKREKLNFLGAALAGGTELVVCVLGGFFIGEWLDQKFNTGAWMRLLGAFAGISIGLYQLIRNVTR